MLTSCAIFALVKYHKNIVIMCACIDIIKETYTDVLEQTEYVAKQSFNMDDYLDAIIHFTKQFESLTEKINNLVELVRDHFTELTVEESKDLLAESRIMRKNMTQLYKTTCDSSLYPGLKTVVKKYHESVSDFSELCNDLDTWNVRIPADVEFQKTIDTLNSLLEQ